MTTESHPMAPARESAVVLYQVLCIAALGLILVPLTLRGLGPAELILLVVGLIGVLGRLRAAPVLLLALLAIAEFRPAVSFGMTRRVFGGSRLDDWLLPCGVLGYVVAHYRLQSLARNVLPQDRRQREPPPGGRVRWFRKGRLIRQRRSAGLVTVGELFLFLMTLPLWVWFAMLFRTWLARRESVFEIRLHPAEARLVFTLWLFGVGGFIVASLLSYWRRRAMTAEEAALLLQDTLWRETRGEQRRLQRWLAWSRVRRATREETP
jgi:hypothetical protein